MLCVRGGEPVVLFQRGAVRLLDSLLSAPQQPIEEVLHQEEVVRLVLLCNGVYILSCGSEKMQCSDDEILFAKMFVVRWSISVVAETQQFVIFTTEEVT